MWIRANELFSQNLSNFQVGFMQENREFCYVLVIIQRFLSSFDSSFGNVFPTSHG